MFKQKLAMEDPLSFQSPKETDLLTILQKCLYIPNQDKLVIRTKIKQKDQQVLNFFDEFKKERVMSELQKKLRKYIQGLKENEKDGERRFNSQQKRIYSEQSLPKSKHNSKRSSPEHSSKKKMITIDISALMKKNENPQKLSLNKTLTKRQKTDFQTLLKSTPYTSKSSKNLLSRKISLATIQSTEPAEPNLSKRQRHPQSSENSTVNHKQFTRSPRYHFYDDISSHQMKGLVKSKLSKRKSSTPCSTQNTQIKKERIFSKAVELGLCSTEEKDKQNIDFQNRHQTRVSPFFTERQKTRDNYQNYIHAVTPRGDYFDPKFGQFYKRIKDILDGNFQ